VRRADDPAVDYRALVRAGYDRCAADYEQARSVESQAGLELLLARLTPGSRVLDLGCGSGVPVARLLARHHSVTGVDFSPEQVRRARANVPSALMLEADIGTVELADGVFDAVVSFYAIFHLPREEHAGLFRRIHGWLAPGGYLLATVGTVSEPAYTEEGFFGVTMYWSNWGREDYESIAREVGFELLATHTLGHGYGDGPRPAESHPLLLARKRV
jgi:cyclopropane fatty-acyl-phospholipid synthase-like methyltransferase